MSEQQSSRIEDARLRALAAKQKLRLAAAAAFVAVVGLAWASHPGSSSTPSSSSADPSSFDESDTFLEEEDDFGGLDSFRSIAPSGGSAPQAQTHVS